MCFTHFDVIDYFPSLGINRQEIDVTALVEGKWIETGKARMLVQAVTGLALMPTKKTTGMAIERFANEVYLLKKH